MKSVTGQIKFGEYAFDFSTGSLLRHEIAVKIQPQPLSVLRALLENPGQIVTRDRLRAVVWGDATYVDFEQGLNFCVRQIRAALSDRAHQPMYIETLPKQGYRFIAPVEIAEAEPREPAAEAASPGSWSHPRRWALAGGGLMLLAFSFWLGSVWAIAGGQEQPPSIAVLPFVNGTGDAAVEAMVDGATSGITRRLALIPGLKVISGASAMQVKGRNLDPRSAARLFGVSTVLSGTIRGAAKDRAFDLEVSDGRDGSLILTRRYARGETDFAELESVVAEDVARSLKARIRGVE